MALLTSAIFGVCVFLVVAFSVDAFFAATFFTDAFFGGAFFGSAFFGGACFAAVVFAATFLALTFFATGARLFPATFLAVCGIAFLAAFVAEDLPAAAFLAGFFCGGRLAVVCAPGRAVFARAKLLRAGVFFDLLGLIAHLQSSAQPRARAETLSIKTTLYAS